MEDLVLRAKRGDKEAFGQIYKAYLKKIYRFICYLTYDQDLSEDLAQNTFLKAWQSLGAFDLGKGTIQAFLFTIARNLVIDWSRKKKEAIWEDEVMERIESKEDIEEDLVKKEESVRVHQALEVLDEFDKQVVILRYFEELSFEEISKILQKEAGAIRVRLHRALKKLKERLEKDET